MQKDLLKDSERVIHFWIAGSDDDFDTMMAMYQAKRYGWTLFMGHLMMEKLLKAYFVKINRVHPPHTHNLVRLAEMSNIIMDENTRTFLTTVTAFNINARYDDYKRTFQSTCTKEFTDVWLIQLKERRTWIRQLTAQ